MHHFYFKLFITVVLTNKNIILGKFTCFSCLDVTSPHDCNQIARCGASEKCYVDSHLDTLGFIRYDLGCRDDYMCTASAMVGKRSGTIPVCRECCTGDLCNDRGCGVAPLNTPGLLCYNCDIQGSVDGCSKVSRCGATEVCSLGLHLVATTGQTMYYSACEKQSMCQSSQLAQGQNTKCPIYCCNTPLCNKQCGTATNYVSQTTHGSHLVTNKPVTMTSRPLDPCLSNPCVAGTCSTYSSTYKCTCNNGYHGRNCDILHTIDHCLNNPCVHGTCNSGQSGYTCTCSMGFVGTKCDSAIDHCLCNPCIHGTCNSGQSGYSCSCNRGYNGKNCDSAIDHCSPDPCDHGSCMNGRTGYTCNCDQGYTGLLCDKFIDPCTSNPCVHGSCRNRGSVYICVCNQGYAGKLCDQVVNHCSSNPCDHGKCVDEQSGYTCNCWQGYTGTLCDKVKCPTVDSSSCQPGALCTVFENGCRTCKPECRIG